MLSFYIRLIVSYIRRSRERQLTHADSVDLANDPNGRVGTAEDMNSVLQSSLINDDISITILVFLHISLRTSIQNEGTYNHPLIPVFKLELGRLLSKGSRFLSDSRRLLLLIIRDD